MLGDAAPWQPVNNHRFTRHLPPLDPGAHVQNLVRNYDSPTPLDLYTVPTNQVKASAIRFSSFHSFVPPQEGRVGLPRL